MRLATMPVRKPRSKTKRATIRLPGSGLIRRMLVKMRIALHRAENIGKVSAAEKAPLSLVYFLICIVKFPISLIGSLSVSIYDKMSKLFSRVWPILCTAAGAVKLAYRETWRYLSEHVLTWERKNHSRATAGLMLAVVTVMLFSASVFGIGLEVSLNGVSIGFVESIDQMNSIIYNAEQRASEYIGAPYSMDVELEYSLRYMDKTNMVDENTVSDLLFLGVSDISEQYVLVVDGQVIGANDSKTAIEMMLRRVIEVSATSTGSIMTEFTEDVYIEQRPVANSEMKSIAEMEQILTGNVSEIQTYTVQSGDTVSAIASRNSMSVSQIQSLNPELEPDSINIGDQVMIAAAVPFVSTKQTITESYNEAVDFETIYEYTEDMYENKHTITREGVLGEAAVVADVVYVNGQEESRTVLEYTVITEPIEQIRLQGTKELPPTAAKGYFIKPTTGVFTSGYGNRPSMGDFHTGVDWANSYGTDIWAADGGKVTFAGWKGNYGYCVYIEHDDTGYVTIYAHCSKLYVSTGDRVSQGQTIAAMGSTGRSTGNHLHFEIRYYGQTQNPLNHIG